MVAVDTADGANSAERELLEHFKRGYGSPPGWWAAIEIGKELQIPPWEVLNEAREERNWIALAIGGMTARTKFSEWTKRVTRR